MLDPSSRSENEARTSWREDVCLNAARVATAVYGIATIGLALSLHGKPQHLLMSLAGLIGFGMSAMATTGWLRPSARPWLIVGPAVATSLVGFATIGFLAGPAVLTTVALLLAGLLLGQRALLALLGVVLVGIGAVGWSMVHGIITAPSPVDVSMTRGVPWIRTMAAMLLGVGLISTLTVEIIGRMERSVDRIRNETRLREAAERATARAEIMALSNRQLESLGQLAAGVAHDFNNNLAAIIGSAELLKEEVLDNEDASELVEGILAASQNAAQLTRQLLVYSSKAQMVLVPVDLHMQIERAVSLVKRSIDPRVEIMTRLDAHDATVLADGALLDNALLNLLVNARDAMPTGGTVTIATSNSQVTTVEGEVAPGLTPGDYVLLEILDTGEGIAPEALPHIFEPFFTTKAFGKGTGLGLAAVAGTIKSLKGSITVESECGCGTAFRVLLPCAEATQSAVTRTAGSWASSGTGRILLVEDEPLVRRAAVAALQGFGYDVTTAQDGVDALEIVRTSSEPFDLVILDLRMPRMDGAATFDILHGSYPRMPVLVWSGNAYIGEVEELIAKGAAGFIPKPYQIAELGQKVHAAIHVTSKQGRVLSSA